MKLIDKVRATPSLLSQHATPPYKVQVEAIKADPTSIRYIKNPQQAIQVLAVQCGGWEAYSLINSPCRAAQVALVHRRPQDVGKLPYDEDLIAQAIKIHPEVVIRYKNLPYWLQKLAVDTSRPKADVTFLIKNPHPDIINEYLSHYPTHFTKFDHLPLEVELRLINGCLNIDTMIRKFDGFRNPSVAAQNHFVRAILAQATRTNRVMNNHCWWQSVTSKIDEELKYMIINTVDWSTPSEMMNRKLLKIVKGTPELESALTLMM